MKARSAIDLGSFWKDLVLLMLFLGNVIIPGIVQNALKGIVLA